MSFGCSIHVGGCSSPPTCRLIPGWNLPLLSYLPLYFIYLKLISHSIGPSVPQCWFSIPLWGTHIKVYFNQTAHSIGEPPETQCASYTEAFHSMYLRDQIGHLALQELTRVPRSTPPTVFLGNTKVRAGPLPFFQIERRKRRVAWKTIKVGPLYKKWSFLHTLCPLLFFPLIRSPLKKELFLWGKLPKENATSTIRALPSYRILEP